MDGASLEHGEIRSTSKRRADGMGESAWIWVGK